MRLSEFIVANMESILVEWETFARSLGAVTSKMDAAALRDHAEAMLLAVAADMETAQSPAQQSAKGKGHAPPRAAALGESAATTHGSVRAGDGFTLEQMVSEYRALRASVLRLWAAHELAAGRTTPAVDAYEQQIRFGEAIDEALADSITTYGRAIDLMFEAKARRRMEALGTLAAGLGHDMSNVLFPMHSCLETIKVRGVTPETRPVMEALERAVDHLGGLTRGLRALAMDADGPAAPAEATDLREWWSTAISPFTWALPPGVRLHVSGLSPRDEPLPPVAVPAHVLMQAVFNIVQNAGQALGQRGPGGGSTVKPGGGAVKHGAAPSAGGNIWIAAAVETPGMEGEGVEWTPPPAPAPPPGPPHAPGPAVLLSIRDDGPGMDEHTLRHCADAFFTTKTRHLGSGLGLYVVRSVLARHGAGMRVWSAPGRGTVFTLRLPAAVGSPVVTRPGHAPAPRRG